MKTFDADSDASGGAYLVLKTAGRWSDVFRLTPPDGAIVGRSSSSQIVIRSDQASRKHAQIAWNGTHWTIEDLGSRNGISVNGVQIEGQAELRDSDLIEIAGFSITFTKVMTAQFGLPEADGGGSQLTDDQLTMPVDAAAITDRRRQSAYLHDGAASPARGERTPENAVDASRSLLKLAFLIANCSSVSEAAETALDAIAAVVRFDTAGVYAGNTSAPQANVHDTALVATRQTGSRSYRQPPASLAKAMTNEQGQAFLARNILGDKQLATQNSRGELDVESVIVAPIRNASDQLLGMVHLTTSAGHSPLSASDLEYAVAAAEILSEALSNLAARRTLNRRLKRTRNKIAQLQKQLGDRVQMIGKSPAIEQVSEQISLAAPTNATVLVRGESGVGKELVAAAIHHASSRKDGPLICMNCAALSPSLLESELFGHEKGAFTGATERKQGKFEASDGGTLMLDEIGEMSQEIQAKFLRVLEGHPFERVGGHEPIKTNVRVVAATNRDLKSMVAEGSFRQDLYYRLNVVEIIVPPLRSRGKDCLHLAEFFLQRFNTEMGRRIEGFSVAAEKRLVDYGWPGNVRELKNVVERAVVLNTKSIIDESDLAIDRGTVAPNAADQSAANVELSLAQLERQHISRVLRHTDGNKSRASSILGIERSTLDRKLKRFKQDDEARK